MRKIIRKIKNKIKSNKKLFTFILDTLSAYDYAKNKILTFVLGDERKVKLKYKKVFGRELDLKNPKTLTEKIQWLKIYEHKDFHTVVADKYAARKFLSDRFGAEYLIPLLFKIENYKDIKPENIPEFPCVIKNNNCSGAQIVRDKDLADWDRIRKICRIRMRENYYYYSNEWQYKNISPRLIIVEKLLQTKDGKIPNDYKLHYINGELEFVYCSIDREGENYRNIYDAEWQPLYFDWSTSKPSKEYKRGAEIPAPASFSKMREIGVEIAKLFKYIRVDFYDVDGKLYYGEITLHHGGGFDVFNPEKYDYYYGEKLNLNFK